MKACRVIVSFLSPVDINLYEVDHVTPDQFSMREFKKDDDDAIEIYLTHLYTTHERMTVIGLISHENPI